MEKVQKAPTGNRLEGLDLARYVAFVGMVIVNFKIAMGRRWRRDAQSVDHRT